MEAADRPLIRSVLQCFFHRCRTATVAVTSRRITSFHEGQTGSWKPVSAHIEQVQVGGTERMIYTDTHQQTALDVCPLKANAGWFTGVRITATSAELSLSVWEDNIFNCLSNHPDFAHSASSEPCCPFVILSFGIVVTAALLLLYY